jgi:hypothetical protein
MVGTLAQTNFSTLSPIHYACDEKEHGQRIYFNPLL